MELIVKDPRRAKAKIYFGEAHGANKAAKQSDDPERRTAYGSKAEYLSRMIVDYDEHVHIDIDHGPGDCISVNLTGNEPNTGLHVPWSDLTSEARKCINNTLEAQH